MILDTALRIMGRIRHLSQVLVTLLLHGLCAGIFQGTCKHGVCHGFCLLHKSETSVTLVKFITRHWKTGMAAGDMLSCFNGIQHLARSFMMTLATPAPVR